jgi:hypothetical protein
VLKIHARVAWQAVDSEVVLVDLDQGCAVGLNETASFLWTRLASRSEAELARELAEAFDVTEEQAAADVAAFVSDVAGRGYVEC